MNETQLPPKTASPTNLELQSNAGAQKAESQSPNTPGMDYWKQLIHYGHKVQRDDPVLAEFATLQRLNLVHIQNRLAEIKADIADHRTTSETQMEELRRLLHEYSTL
jgi:hypothetical protein